MVRLVLLSFMLVLAGCSQAPQKPEQITPDAASELPALQDNRLGALDEGTHHPAVQNLLQKAEAARQQGRWSAVNTYLDQARQIQPRNPAIFYRQAWVALQQNDGVQAEQLLQRALMFAQGDVVMEKRLYQLLADSYDQQGRVLEAQAVRHRVAN